MRRRYGADWRTALKREVAKETPEKILLVRLSAIGDIVHTMPSAVAIKRFSPHWELHWVVQENFADLLRGHPAVDRLIETPRRPSLRDLWELRKSLRAERYGIALDMQGLLKSGRIVWLSGAKRRLGFHWQREGARLFSRPVKPKADRLHVVEQYLAVVEKLKGETPEVQFDLRPQPAALASVRPKLEALGLRGRPLAINLGAGKPEKRWPLLHYARLIELTRGFGWAPFVIGGPEDARIHSQLGALMESPPPSLAGQTTLAELVALLSLVHAHVGGDTGSVHIAVALGKPVVAIMGPTSPERSGPYGRPDFVLYKGPHGLAEIEPEEVLTRLKRLLA